MESIFVNLITVAGSEADMSIIGLLLKASFVVKAVIVVLILMSVATWYIIVFKWNYLRKAKRESASFLETFWASKKLDEIYRFSDELEYSPISQVFRAGYVELTKVKSDSSSDTMHGQMGGLENIERALRRARNAETVHLESHTPFLATTASAAPFVGLFGTVWGIMASFLSIAREGDASLLTVAPGIAEALIATAIGLVAAIPAVIAYNWFLNQMRILEAEMDNFGNDFLNIVKRHFFK